MRSRKEIEKQITDPNRHIYEGMASDNNSLLILEVCLDIRDLLIKNDKNQTKPLHKQKEK